MNIGLNLLDNGLDYMVEGLKPATRMWGNNEVESVWKYSVLNVFSGIELILKHRLKQEHWSLIFEDVSNANELRLEQGDFISVNHCNVIKRLNGICNIRINDTPIDELRKLRNKFEHFEVKVEVKECKQVIASAIRELIIFWNENIAQNSTKEQNQKFNWIKSMAFEFDTYAHNMLQKNEKKIEGIVKSNSGILVHCQSCSNLSFIIYTAECRMYECVVCEDTMTKESFMTTIRESELEMSRGESLFASHYNDYDHHCSNCKNESRFRIKPSHFLPPTEEYQPDYFFCIECFHHETQTEINSRELEKELLELERHHSPEEFLKILKSKIKYIEEDEK